jgi:hypothetical protein
MRTRWLECLAAAAVLLSPVLATAIDAPHDATFSDGNCNNCHTMFDSSASGAADYDRACLSCHNSKPGGPSGFPWLTSDQARPGLGGNQHNWSAFAVNARLGTTAPASSTMSQHLVDGRLQCEVCHDPHKSAPENLPGARHTSIPVGTPVSQSGGPAGTAQMTLVAPGAVAKGYRVQILSVSAGGGTFIISHDFGLPTRSWFNWNGSAWVAGTATGPGGTYSNGATVALDDPAVTVSFSAGAVAGAYWDFFVAYPFLRVTMLSDTMCGGCHANRVLDIKKSGGLDSTVRPDGQRIFSHPVSVALGANGRNTDLTAAAMLDTGGQPQASGDGNVSNDLRLDAGIVRCTTCHAIHNADSNSLSVDVR